VPKQPKAKPPRFTFVQTGDWHIGRGRTTWGEAISMRRGAFVIGECYRVAREHKAQALLVCGDVCDTKYVTNAERELLIDTLVRGTSGPEGIETYVSVGNHDMTTATTSNLDFLAVLAATGEIPRLHVGFAHQAAIWNTAAPGLAILGAPPAVSEHQGALEAVVDALDTSMDYVVMGHGTIGGCVRNDMGWKPPSEQDAKRLSLLHVASNAPHVRWWAYGDIHKRQELPTLPEGSYGWYAGSPIQMDFGETPDRGVLVVSLDQREDRWQYRGRKYVRLDTPESGIEPLVRVLAPEDLDDLPEHALIQLGPDLMLPTERYNQVISKYRVVDDRSTPVAAREALSIADVEQGVQLQAFDPLMADLHVVEEQVLREFKYPDDAALQEAKKIVGLARERYRARTYLS